MMATVIKTPPLGSPIQPLTTTSNKISLKSPKPPCLSFRLRRPATARSSISSKLQLAPPSRSTLSLRFVPLASQGETETETETETKPAVQDPEIEDSSEGAIGVEDGAAAEEEQDGASGVEEDASARDRASSISVTALQSYKEALANEDESRIAETESFLKSVEDEKTELEEKVATLTAELSAERDRVLRISADFDNFRKRTGRERLSLLTNAQGEVVENLLSVLDNFERAKTHIKIETEGEEKINNNYQSIHKQFVEILGSLGVVPVETVGNPFDPMLHEAIMREDSTEFEDGIILEEYRKGFKLGDRLLRPSMVKVSAGPGPAKTEQDASSEEAGTLGVTALESSEDGSLDGDSA